MAKNVKPKGYKVPPLSRADVFAKADKLRSDFGMAQTLYFDIVRFIESILPMCDSDFDFKVVEDHELPHQLALTLPDKKLMVVRHSVYRGAVDTIFFTPEFRQRMPRMAAMSIMKIRNGKRIILPESC